MSPRPGKAKLAKCAVFNEKHPVGASVRVWRGVMGDGPSELVQTTGAAYVLQGHTPVVHVTGGRGCVALTHVRPA